MEDALSRKLGLVPFNWPAADQFWRAVARKPDRGAGGETLVNDKVQHEFVMRLDADSQVLERVALVAEKSFALRHEIRGQQSLLIQLPLFQELGFEQAAFATLGESLRHR